MAKAYPNMKSAVMHWASRTTVFVVCKSLSDYEVKESFNQLSAIMLRIPTGQDLMMKPEGQRAWNGETLYADTSLQLGVDDIIIFDDINSTRYRVVSKTDYSNYGFIEYNILSDYT
jgi:hypothetical protein